MNYILMFMFIAAVGTLGCGDERNQGNRASTPSATAPDNTARNQRDRGDATKTAGDQAENEVDRTITQQVRQAITSDDTLSTDAKNVKIITNDGTVTLRGPVKSEQEKTKIEAKAKQVAGVKQVENQLEVAS